MFAVSRFWALSNTLTSRARRFRHVLLVGASGGALLVNVPIMSHAQNQSAAVQSELGKIDQKDVTELRPDSYPHRDIAGGQSHYYRIALKENYYVNLRAVCWDADLVLSLFGPDGRKLDEVDTPVSTLGRKSLMHNTAIEGNYHLVIRTRDTNAPAGRYMVHIVRLLAINQQNADLIVADRATDEGWRLHEIGTEAALREAAGKFKEALTRWAVLGDRAEEATTWMYLGEVYFNVSEYEEALKSYERALPVWKELQNLIGEGWTFNNIGAIYSAWGEKHKALASFLSSLRAYDQSVSKDSTQKRGLGIALTAIGGAYVSLGEKEKAVDYLSRAIPYWRAADDPNGEARALFQLAEVHSSVGDYGVALENYQKALHLWRSTSDLFGEGRALTGIGRLHTRSGEYQKALDFLSEALRVRSTSGDRRGQARTLTDLGVVYFSLGDSQKAAEYYKQSLPLHLAVNDREGEANSLYWFARADRDMGNLLEAHDKIERAIKIIERVRTSIAEQGLRASYFATVRDYYEFKVNLLMLLHQRNPSTGFNAAALKVSEQSRVRGLLETLASARVDIDKGVDRELIERKLNLQRQLSAKADYQIRLARKNPVEAQIAAVAKEIDALTNEYQQVRANIHAASPQYAALTDPQSLGLREIQQELLDPDAILLEYFLGNDRSYIWVVSQTSLLSFELPKRAEIEKVAMRFYQTLTARNLRPKNETAEQRQKRLVEAEKEFPEAGLELSRMLLGPVASQLTRKRLIVVTEGVLQYVPFAALPVPFAIESQQRGKLSQASRNPTRTIPLVANHEIVSLPSASTLAVLRRETRQRTLAPKALAVLADPVFEEHDLRVSRNSRRKKQPVLSERQSSDLTDLQRSALEVGASDLGAHIPRLVFSRTEAQRILRLVPPAYRKQALDFEASKSTAMSSELADFRILHLATHAFLNNLHPELSGVVFSLVDKNANQQDGYLRLHEIYNLKLRADLVVLSACQSGLGKDIKGEGMLGLTRGFMYAGTPRVVASLWKIDDRATAELMTRFYEGMLGGERLRAAAALRKAQVDMWQKGTSPYYWAAFVLQGEWQ